MVWEGPDGPGRVKKVLNRSDGSAMIWKGPGGSGWVQERVWLGLGWF